MKPTLPGYSVFKSRVAYRFIRALVVFSTCITLVTTGIQLATDYQRDVTGIETSIDLVRTSYLETITQSLWVFDDEQLGTQLSGLLAIPDIEFVKIKREGGGNLSRGARRSENVIFQTFPIVYRDRTRAVNLGQLEIVASLNAVYQRLFDKALVVLVGNGIKTFLVAGFLFLVFYYLVSRHLTHIGDFVRTLDLRKPQKDLSLDKKGPPDEFDQISDALNEMSTNLRANEERFAFAMSGTNDGVFDWSVKTGEDYFSPRWKEILGYEEHEVEHHVTSFTDALHPDDRERTSEAIRDHLEKRVPYDIEYRIRRKAGDYVWVRARGQAVWDKNGDPIRMAGSISDITERVAAEDNIRKLNDELEQRVEDRTRELRELQAELVRRERLAILGQLAATVSHELRNPLGTIASSVGLIEASMAAGTPAQNRAIARIKRSIVRCDRIIEEMLDFARERKMMFMPVVIDTWLADVLSEQELPGHIALKFIPGAGDAPSDLDPELFRRAIVNLLNNAQEAILEGDAQAEDRPREITVETRRVGDEVEIVISDSGPGMKEEVRSKVFEPLYSTKNFGVGLGLPIVRKIVEQHGGDIDLQSVVGKGSRFSLKLPAKHEDENACLNA